MSLDDIKQMDKPFITPAIAARIIGCEAHYIRLAAREDPASLGFPTLCVKSRVKIHRLPFIRWVETGCAYAEAQDETA